MQLELAAAYWRLNMLRSFELAEIGAQALVDGLDSPRLRMLAGETDDIDARRLFVLALRELGIPIPDEFNALMTVIKHTARHIIEGEVTPRKGARTIWRLQYDLPQDAIDKMWEPLFRPMVAACDRLDELEGPPFTDSFESEEALNAARDELNETIVAAARKIVEYDVASD